MKRQGVTIFLILLIAFMTACTAPILPFDPSLSGSYEIISTQGTPIQHLLISDNGAFIADSQSGWIERIDQKSMRLKYDSGEIRYFTYQLNDYQLDLYDDETAPYQYIDTIRFSEKQDDYPSGLYCDQTGTILIEFVSETEGVLLGIHGEGDHPFTYIMRDGILRLQYGTGETMRFEYLYYAFDEQRLVITWPDSDDTAVLVPANEPTSLWGEYALLDTSQPANPYIARNLTFPNDTHTNDSVETVITFGDDAIVIKSNDALAPYQIERKGLVLRLYDQNYQLVATYIHESLFFNDKPALAAISGIYASEDLSLILSISPDGHGMCTQDGHSKPVYISTRNNWLRCEEKDNGHVFYFEYWQKDNGLLIKNAVGNPSETKDFIFMKRLQ